MFTGIITAVGRVRSVEPIADGLAAAYLPIVDRPLRAPVAYDAWLAVAQRALSVLARR